MIEVAVVLGFFILVGIMFASMMKKTRRKNHEKSSMLDACLETIKQQAEQSTDIGQLKSLYCNIFLIKKKFAKAKDSQVKADNVITFIEHKIEIIKVSH